MQSDKPEITRKDLETALRKQAKIVLSDAQLEKLWQFHCHLRKRNFELNLSRIHSFPSIVRKHYIDCLLVPRFLKEAGMELQGRLLDIGSGPGFPGIPLAIACPDIHVILAEGRRQRTEFLQEVIELLDLANAEVFSGRVHSHQNHQADFVITRAVESMKDTLRHAEGNTRPNACYVFMKGPNCTEEIEDVQKLHRYLLVLDKSYTLPKSDDRRRLVVWKSRKTLAIRSSENKKFKQLKSLLNSKGIKKERLCLVSGPKIVSEILKNPTSCNPDGSSRIEAVVAHPGLPLPNLESLESPPAVLDLSPTLFFEIDSIGSKSPMLLLRPPALRRWKKGSDKLPEGLSVYLPLQDPLNLGAAIRSCLAFGVAAILLPKEAAHPYHPKTIRASAGASLFAPLYESPSVLDLQKNLKENTLLALDAGGPNEPSLSEFRFPRQCLLVMGEEGRGIPDGLEARRLSIAIQSSVESLNANVSLAIALYEYRRQHRI